jgi:hypothetical protein
MTHIDTTTPHIDAHLHTDLRTPHSDTPIHNDLTSHTDVPPHHDDVATPVVTGHGDVHIPPNPNEPPKT